MAVPDFQSLMLPLLKITGDGNEHSTSEVIEILAQQFGLGENDRDEMLPSGKQRKLDNRVNWTKTYLQKALLLSSTGRSKFRITERGIKVLKENPPSINVKFLNQFPEFLAFHTVTNSKEGKTNGTTSASQEIVEKTSQTPQEILEISYQNLRQTLVQELLERIKNNSPKFFESLVVDLLVAIGYGGSRKDAGQAIGQVGDGGIDGIIKEDKLGLDVIYLQAKRWEGTVGGPVVQGFAGALIGKKARKGIILSAEGLDQRKTGRFTYLPIGGNPLSLARIKGRTLIFEDGDIWSDSVEMSPGEHTACMFGWSESNFSLFAFELIEVMNGTYRPGFLASQYGLNFRLETNS